MLCITIALIFDLKTYSTHISANALVPTPLTWVFDSKKKKKLQFSQIFTDFHGPMVPRSWPEKLPFFGFPTPSISHWWPRKVKVKGMVNRSKRFVDPLKRSEPHHSWFVFEGLPSPRSKGPGVFRWHSS